MARLCCHSERSEESPAASAQDCGDSSAEGSLGMTGAAKAEARVEMTDRVALERSRMSEAGRVEGGRAIDNRQSSFDIALSPGVYLLRLSGGANLTRKLVIE